MILFLFAALVVIAAVIYFIVKLVKNGNKEEKKDSTGKLSLTLLFKIYLYVISFATLLIALYGGATLLKVGGSYLFGLPFSYDFYSANAYDYDVSGVGTPCYRDQEMSINGQTVCFDASTRTEDLISGTTLFITMVILFVVHQYALAQMNKKKITPWLEKVYNFGSLVLYSLLGIVLIPTAIYQLTSYIIYSRTDVTIYSAPGTAVSFLVLVLPLWIYFLLKVTRVKEAD